MPCYMASLRLVATHARKRYSKIYKRIFGSIYPGHQVNPCKTCLEVYEKFLCEKIGHCVFEGTNIKPEKIFE